MTASTVELPADRVARIFAEQQGQGIWYLAVWAPALGAYGNQGWAGARTIDRAFMSARNASRVLGVAEVWARPSKPNRPPRLVGTWRDGERV